MVTPTLFWVVHVEEMSVKHIAHAVSGTELAFQKWKL